VVTAQDPLKRHRKLKPILWKMSYGGPNSMPKRVICPCRPAKGCHSVRHKLALPIPLHAKCFLAQGVRSERLEMTTFGLGDTDARH